MKLVLVPQWVEQAMAREEMSLRAVLDPEKLLSTLSKEDVAFYLWLNQHLDRWLPKEVSETFSTGYGNALPFNQEQREELESYFLNFQLDETKRVKKEKGVLNTCELFDPLGPKFSSDEVSYTIRVIGYDTLVLLPRKTETSSLMGMVKELLFNLNGRTAFHNVAKTPLFRFFVKTV